MPGISNIGIRTRIGIGHKGGGKYITYDGVRYLVITLEDGTLLRKGVRDGYLVIDQTLTALGFGVGSVENTDWVNISAIVMYPDGFADYFTRVADGGGSITDLALLNDELIFVADNNLFNKIGYWVDNDLGKFMGNPALKVPLISFSFDDGKSTDYTVYQSFVAKGIGRGTSFINTKYIGTAGYLTWAQVAEMVVGGWDFQCHTWSHAMLDIYGATYSLLDLSNAEIVSEIENSNTDFIAHGLPVPIHLAYPIYLSDFTRVLPIVGKYRRSMRGGGTDYVTGGNYNKLSWWSNWGDSTSFITDIVALKASIDLAVLHNQILHLPGHSSAAGGYITGLETILDWIYGKGLVPKTIGQYYAGVNAYRDKLFNIIEGTDDGSLKNYEPIVYMDSGLKTDKQGIIIFNDTLANVTATCADHFINLGYQVGFWTDAELTALAYSIPNNTKAYNEEPVTAEPTLNKIVFPYAVNNIFQLNTRIYLTGTTAPTNLSFNTMYFVKANAGNLAFTLSATSGGAVIDFTDAGVNVKLSTYGFRDSIILQQTAANCTPEKLTKRTTSLDQSYWNCGGNLSDCGINYLKTMIINTEILLSRNRFTGIIPKEFNFLGTKFKSIDLRYNLLTGGTINVCNHIYSLLSLELRNNLINEVIPDEIGNLRTLTTGLYLSFNQYYGSIPRSMGNLVKLISFYADNNLLTGIIPVETGLMIKLVNYNLSTNLLSGYEAGAISTGMTVLANINFSVNALPSSAINQILADTLALHIVSGTVITLTLTGGTNAAPAGQGATDKAALIAHGCTVTTN